MEDQVNIKLLTDTEVEQQQNEAREKLKQYNLKKAAIDEHLRKLASISSLMKDRNTTWTENFLSQIPSETLLVNLQSVWEEELKFLNEYWQLYALISDEEKEAGERQRTKLEMTAENLTFRIQNQLTNNQKEEKEAITQAKQSAFQEAEQKAAVEKDAQDKLLEEAKKELETIKQQAEQKIAEEKAKLLQEKGKEIDNVKNQTQLHAEAEKAKQEKLLTEKNLEIENLKKQKDLEIAKVNEQLQSERDRLNTAKQRINELLRTNAQHTASGESSSREIHQLKEERNSILQKFDEMVKEDEKEDKEYEKAIKLKELELEDLQGKYSKAREALEQREKALLLKEQETGNCKELEEALMQEAALRAQLEKELKILARENALDEEHCEFQIRLHQTLVEQLKNVAGTHPAVHEPYTDLMFGDQPDIIDGPSSGMVDEQFDVVDAAEEEKTVADLLKLSTAFTTLKDLTDFDFLEASTRTQLIERKEYLAKKEKEFNDTYNYLEKSFVILTDEKQKWLDVRSNFIDDANALMKKLDDQIAKIDEKLNKPQPAPPVRIQRRAEVSEAPASEAPASGVAVEFKFDKIELATFAGNLTEWNSWKEVFLVLVHNSTTIPAIMKFHQLRSHLRGPALETISGYQLTASNYLPAWEDLKNRFDRKDNIIHHYIKKFIEVPILSSHSPYQKIFTIVNGTRQMLRALPGLDVNVTHWDPFILFILLSKLDDETRRAWKNQIGRKENSTVTELLEFLETKAIESQPSMSEHMYDMLVGRKIPSSTPRDQMKKNQTKIFQVNTASTSKPVKGERKRISPYKCPLPKCNGPHNLYFCPIFKKLTPINRKKEIENLHLCFKCFQPHFMRDCSAKNCPRCNGLHNSLLCFPKNTNGNTYTKKEDWDSPVSKN